MTAAMTDERLAEIRAHIARPVSMGTFASPFPVIRDDILYTPLGSSAALELVAEVYRLRNALAAVYDLHVCIAPGARPMCHHDGENWPCATIAAIGPDALYTRGDQ